MTSEKRLEKLEYEIEIMQVQIQNIYKLVSEMVIK